MSGVKKEEMRIRTITVSSCEEFKGAMLGFQQIINARRDYPHPVFLFRGAKIQDENALLSTIDKKFRRQEVSIHLGREMFKRFKELMSLGDSYSDWDVLSLARHYELPTRYLDWSSNSLVSLWFAIHNQINGKSVLAEKDTAVIWVLETRESDFGDITKYEEPFPVDQGRTLIFKPTQMEGRIKNQDSYMMRQVYVYKDPLKRARKCEDMEIERVNENLTFAGRLTRIILQGNYLTYDRMLKDFGIEHDYLFSSTRDHFKESAKNVCKQVEDEFKEYKKYGIEK